MANNISTYLKNKLLNHVFGSDDYTPPTNLYLALFSARPTVGNTGGTEFSGNGYERVEIVNNTTNFPVITTGDKVNGTAFQFPEATGDQGTAVCVCVFDSDTGGNLLFISNAISVDVPTSTIVYFDAGDLIFSLS